MLQRTEVLTILAHLLISLAVLILYGYTVAIGKPDTTLQNLLLIIGGWWFGAMGKSKVTDIMNKRKSDGKGDEG